VSTATISIQDVPSGVRFSGRLAYQTEQATPAAQIAAYLAANQETIARQSWAWYAAQNVAIKTVAKE
jgi:hypothetical protein